MSKTVGILLIALAVALGCDEKLDPVQTGDESDTMEETVTYTKHTKAIFDADCTSCHATTKSGADRYGAPIGVDFDTYETAATSGDLANQRVQADVMPPAGPLSNVKKSLLRQWVEDGLIE